MRKTPESGRITVLRYTERRIPDALAFERALREEEDVWGWEIDDDYVQSVTVSFRDGRFSNCLSYLAFEDGSVIGRIDAVLIPTHFDGSVKAYLDWICVLKSKRHNKVAQKLLSTLSKELKERGVDTGLDAKEGVSRIGGCSLYGNARGEKFAVSDVGWYDLDCREASPTPVPVREIWRFFTGKDIPVCIAGARGVHLIAKRRPDGSLAVLANNTRGGAVGPFTVNVPGASYDMALPAYGCRTLQVGGGGN